MQTRCTLFFITCMVFETYNECEAWNVSLCTYNLHLHVYCLEHCAANFQSAKSLTEYFIRFQGAPIYIFLFLLCSLLLEQIIIIKIVNYFSYALIRIERIDHSVID